MMQIQELSPLTRPIARALQTTAMGVDLILDRDDNKLVIILFQKVMAT